MLYKYLSPFIALLTSWQCLVAQNTKGSDVVKFAVKKSNIQIICHLDGEALKDNMKFEISPTESLDASSLEWSSHDVKPTGDIAICILHSKSPVFFSLKRIYKYSLSRTLLLEPGDSLVISSKGQHLFFHGRGSDKAKLQWMIDSTLAKIHRPENNRDHITVSVQDYIDWYRYLNKQLELVLPIIDSYNQKLSSYAFNLIKAIFVDQNIDDRSDKFASLAWSYGPRNGMSTESICAIYDSTYYPVVNRYFRVAADYVFGTWKPIWFKVDRKYQFNYTEAPLSSSIERKLLYYDEGKVFYKGRIRELFMQKLLVKEFIRRLGFTPETERLLAEYYKDRGFPAYKKWLMEFEGQRRKIWNEKNQFDFILKDSNGLVFDRQRVGGKVAVFDFWFTGCAGCIDMVPAFEKVKNQFKADSNIVFFNVSVDKDREKWLKSIREGRYTNSNGIHLYTGDSGMDNDIIRKCGIQGFPSILVLNPWGGIVHSLPRPDPRVDNGKKLIALLEQQQVLCKDGPYVFKDSLSSIAYSINCSTVSLKKIDKRDAQPLYLSIGKDKTASFFLKKELKVEPSVFKKADRLFVLSDIEGNLDALIKLLQGNGVIDENYNWKFGMGHLVFNGDMFDRGDQVSECLWLIYSLEEKARQAGGYVHFILGNHEIMNLQGDTRYVRPKYFYGAELMGKNIKELYKRNTELGDWLRTKNIMERIGDILFVHGGISKEFTDSVALTIDGVNNVFRANLNESKKIERDARFIFSQHYSPFWFRQYYEDKDGLLEDVRDTTRKLIVHHPSEDELEVILSKWGAEKIVTGHTVVADTVSVHYNGKVFNTDTKHIEGESEALLIEGHNYYRVDQLGRRYSLLNKNSEVRMPISAE